MHIKTPPSDDDKELVPRPRGSEHECRAGALRDLPDMETHR